MDRQRTEFTEVKEIKEEVIKILGGDPTQEEMVEYLIILLRFERIFGNEMLKHEKDLRDSILKLTKLNSENESVYKKLYLQEKQLNDVFSTVIINYEDKRLGL